MFSPQRSRRGAAFTLLEAVTVVLVVLILAAVALPSYQHVLRRLERTRCMTNMRSLHVAMDLYLQDHRGWPQISEDGDPVDVATNWINTLKPYGAEQITWICPTQQKNAGSPDLADKENARVDYAVMPFDSNPQTPMRYPHYPWFIERSDVHGNGQLLGYADGSIGEVGDYKSQFQRPSP